MLTVSRQYATAQAIPTYFTGKPCKYGHVAQRYTCNGKCKTCNAGTTRVWQQANRKRTSLYCRTTAKESMQRLVSLRYSGMVRRVKYMEGYKGLYLCSKEDFIRWVCTTKKDLDAIYTVWKDSGYLHRLSPSVDRIVGSLGYAPGNMQWLTTGANTTKALKERWAS